MTVKRSRPLIAAAMIAILFVLSQDYWTWTDPVALSVFGLPRWVYLFAALQGGISVVVLWYGYGNTTSKDAK